MNAAAKSRAWISLSRRALEHNVAVLRSRLPRDCRLMPAVKAEAYGHGAELISRELNRLGVDAFCVATAREGALLRQSGIQGEILVLGYTHPALFSELSRWKLSQTVTDFDYAQALSAFEKPISVHVGVDTGMRRLGIPVENYAQIREVFRLPGLRVEGMFTHLAADDTLREPDVAFTRRQAGAFLALAERLERDGIPPVRKHMLASYGVFLYPEYAGDYARVGIALYGVLSTREDTLAWAGELQPVLSLKARVASVRDLHPGESAGYGMAYVASQERRIAALSIGYADGLPRALSQGVGSVLLHGRRAKIIGRVCMDQTLVDVTDIPGVQTGDEAVLIGTSGSETISCGELADQCGTITNEILSRMGARLERIME